MLSIHRHPHGIAFKILIQPRSSKNMIVGLHGDALKIKLTAPPVDNAANKMCIKFLANQFGIPVSRIEIISGRSNRTKQVLLKYGQPDVSEKERAHLENQVKQLTTP